MIGFVVVSHSEPLAEAAVDLALQMVHGEQPPVKIAAGAAGGFGTDAAAIAGAIDALADSEGVVILTDLGSATLSSELALELRESSQPVRISTGPFVEGATAGIVRAATGGTLEEVVTDADSALRAKQPDAGGAPTAPAADPAPEQKDTAPSAEHAVIERALLNPMGIHSRPAAVLVKEAGRFDATIEISDVTTGKGPVKAKSMVGMLSLGTAKDHVVRVEATGPDAADAVAAFDALILEGFGELDD
ncbi:HPr family phosphocarrier protein [Microbacterium aquimaris]|uniref:HPr family phosphocarrier protein n=1 Tax=Microbacterium aquimaris TaxID=459816 RepID=UPI002AD55673|nr:HPr family phosphocarrier protein [Microbacterium aquimaris]MDZ8275681.1 HPr family phosphocarrier protein [Microbacterium aquimaris]